MINQTSYPVSQVIMYANLQYDPLYANLIPGGGVQTYNYPTANVWHTWTLNTGSHKVNRQYGVASVRNHYYADNGAECYTVMTFDNPY